MPVMLVVMVVCHLLRPSVGDCVAGMQFVRVNTLKVGGNTRIIGRARSSLFPAVSAMPAPSVNDGPA